MTTAPFLLSIIGFAIAKPHVGHNHMEEASGFMGDGLQGTPRLEMMDMGSGLQPRLNMLGVMSEDEGSGLQSRLEMLDMGSEEEGSGLKMLDMEFVNEGSGLQPRLEMLEVRTEMLELESVANEALSNEEIGSAEFRMAELTEVHGEDDDAELGSGDFRTDEVGSGMKDHLSESEVEAKIVDEEMAMEMTSDSDVEREPKTTRIISKLMKTLGSAVGGVVRIKQNLADQTIKAKLNLSKGLIEAKKNLADMISK